MVEIDGTVSDDQGLASNGGKNNTSNYISNNLYVGRDIRSTNIGVDTIVSEI
jgi:hypothetical protein